jgi:hypothetical protein
MPQRTAEHGIANIPKGMSIDSKFDSHGTISVMNMKTLQRMGVQQMSEKRLENT